MSSHPKLNFPAVKLRASRRGERTLVWDDLRAMWLVLTPEEWVRRHLIAYLETGCGAARQRIVQEYPVAMNGAPQRADVVVVDDAATGMCWRRPCATTRCSVRVGWCSPTAGRTIAMSTRMANTFPSIVFP